jgi:N-acyl homoserine lactone hydrolase
MTYDAKVSAASIDKIWQLWRARQGTILVPGHDLPMTLEGATCRYLGKREAAITAWLGDDLQATTAFQLTAD